MHMEFESKCFCQTVYVVRRLSVKGFAFPWPEGEGTLCHVRAYHVCTREGREGASIHNEHTRCLVQPRRQF